MLSTEVGFDDRSDTDDIDRWALIAYENMYGLLCAPMVEYEHKLTVWFNLVEEII